MEGALTSTQPNNKHAHDALNMIPQAQFASSGVKKRSRQACTNCRSRKIKCSAERPTCTNCRQNCRSCSYEPYSNRPNKDAEASSPSQMLGANAELLKRISVIESMLGKLNPEALEQAQTQLSPTRAAVSASPGSHRADQSQQHCSSSNSTAESSQFRADSFESLPPPHVMNALVDTYFLRVNGQPYLFLHEAGFRRRFDSHSVPNHLFLAVSSLAIRFMSHQYYSGRIHEASSAYAKQAWALVLTEHLMVLNNITLQVVQTISILAVVDYASGRVSTAWLKVGLAARLAQGLELMDEPPAYIPIAEQEERRRTFWSIYLLDRLMACARTRPSAIYDDDCNVQLPSESNPVNARDATGAIRTLRPLLSWDTKLNKPPRGFCLTILMAMVLGRCTKFAHGRSDTESVPPYDPKSEFMAINSSLMLLESYLEIDKSPISEVIREARQNNSLHNTATGDSKDLGHTIFSRALFHISHCLLNHPFLLRHRLSSFSSKVPRSFSLRALQLAEDHAKKLTYLLSSASEEGVLVESPFYSYCATVSGAIHIMADRVPQNEDNLGQYDAAQYFQRSIDILSRLGHLWPMAKNMETRLRRFNDVFPSQLGLFNPSLLATPIDPTFDELLWSVVDYNTLAGELPKWDVFPSMTALPSPSLWDLDMTLPSVTQELDLGVTNLFPEQANMFTHNVLQ